MSTVGEICSRDLVTVRKQEPLATAARLMFENHVGCIVVVDDHGGDVFPAGIVTDRDVAHACARRTGDFEQLRVVDAMTKEPVIVRDDEPLASAIERMEARGVRRAPVLDRHGTLVGLLTMDDVLPYLTEQLRRVGRLVATQPHLERR
jgi:CBS domain-containing protein